MSVGSVRVGGQTICGVTVFAVWQCNIYMVLAYVQHIYVSDLWLLRSRSMMQTNATPLVWAVNFAKTTVVVELLIKAKAEIYNPILHLYNC